jgi:hypothetical protein
MSKVLIAGFKEEAAETEFMRRISDATIESLLFMSAAKETTPLVTIVQVRRIAKGNRRLYSEHQPYAALFYLNEAAVAMCEDLDFSMNYVGEAEAMSEEASFDLEAYYVPLQQRQKG